MGAGLELDQANIYDSRPYVEETPNIQKIEIDKLTAAVTLNLPIVSVYQQRHFKTV